MQLHDRIDGLPGLGNAFALAGERERDERCQVGLDRASTFGSRSTIPWPQCQRGRSARRPGNLRAQARNAPYFVREEQRGVLPLISSLGSRASIFASRAIHLAPRRAPHARRGRDGDAAIRPEFQQVGEGGQRCCPRARWRAWQRGTGKLFPMISRALSGWPASALRIAACASKPKQRSCDPGRPRRRSFRSRRPHPASPATRRFPQCPVGLGKAPWTGGEVVLRDHVARVEIDHRLLDRHGADGTESPPGPQLAQRRRPPGTTG